MKKILTLLTSLFTLPILAIAQNQGDDMGLGGGGVKILCYVNTSGAAIASGQGKANYVGCDTTGAIRTVSQISDGTNSLDVIPLSSSVGLNGIPSGLVGWYRISSPTITTGSTTTSIKITGIESSARVGDVLQLKSGTAGNIGAWSVITAVATDTLTVSPAFPGAPANTDTAFLLRPSNLAASSPANTLGATLFVNVDANNQNSTATGLLKLEDVAAASGDAGVFALGVRNLNLTSVVSADADYSQISTGSYGNTLSTILYDPNLGSANSPVRQEDQSFGNGEAIMMAGGVNNRNGSSFNATNGDATPIGTGDFGNVLNTLFYDPQFAGTLSPIFREDIAVPTDAAVVLAGAQAVSAIAQSVGTSGDAAPPSMDLGNRLVTTSAPAGETWSTCSSAETGTANHAIKNLVASNRIYVTNLSCSNTATVASVISFNDGSTTLYGGGISNSTLQGVGHTEWALNPPLRTASGAPLNFVLATTATNTICCANGYISTI